MSRVGSHRLLQRIARRQRLEVAQLLQTFRVESRRFHVERQFGPDRHFLGSRGRRNSQFAAQLRAGQRD
jgi:hypothetical protein